MHYFYLPTITELFQKTEMTRVDIICKLKIMCLLLIDLLEGLSSNLLIVWKLQQKFEHHTWKSITLKPKNQFRLKKKNRWCSRSRRWIYEVITAFPSVKNWTEKFKDRQNKETQQRHWRKWKISKTVERKTVRGASKDHSEWLSQVKEASH